jgi:hypothetical protein
VVSNPRRKYTFRVKENEKDAQVANLSNLDFGQGKGQTAVKDILILNNDQDQESREKFTVTDAGLLLTKVRTFTVLAKMRRWLGAFIKY